ncbi:MAG: PEP-CTERM sorting domain-containing protein [Zoogloeaceae bacterium]|nr:PEP-CTERM sorting domain-containing protein [Rhodocyclaceae bacterium]MCP5236475.1 PEP-CTERM sorting domain-containing protein [Zoogloeaceae bacterium]
MMMSLAPISLGWLRVVAFAVGLSAPLPALALRLVIDSAQSWVTITPAFPLCDADGNCGPSAPSIHALSGTLSVEVLHVDADSAATPAYDMIRFTDLRLGVAGRGNFEQSLFVDVLEGGRFSSSVALPATPGQICSCFSMPDPLAYEGSWDGRVLQAAGSAGSLFEPATFALVASTVPEPSEAAMWLLGLSLLGARLRRGG